MTTHRNEPATSTFGGRRLAHTRAAMVAFMLLALIPLLARSAAADACTAGCKVAAKACRLSGKIEAKGCYRSCQAVFAASDFEEADKLAYVACKSSCKAELASDVSACETIGSTCSASCDSSACAETCGTILNGCSSLTLAATKACAGSCAGNGACLQACSEPGSVAAHHGDAALADCLFHPTHGYSICRTSGCAALCGNTIQEPGEACDDGGTTDGDGCSATCILEGADGDVIASDGDNSGTAGDNPCSGGNTVNCEPRKSRVGQIRVDRGKST